MDSLQKSGKESQLYLIPEEPDDSNHDQPLPTSSENPENQQNLYKDEVAAMGVVQIMVGITTVVFGSFLRSAYVGQTSITLVSKVTNWAGIMFVIGGASDVFAQKHRGRDNVIVSVTINIITTIAATAAVIIYPFDLASSSYDPCFNEGTGVAFTQCKKYREAFLILQNGTLVVLLVFAVLELCISIAIMVFAIQALCGKSSHSGTLQPELFEQNIYEDPKALSMQDASKWPSYGTNSQTPEAIPPTKP